MEYWSGVVAVEMYNCSKEYFQIWFTLLDLFKSVQDLEFMLKQLSEENGIGVVDEYKKKEMLYFV